MATVTVINTRQEMNGNRTIELEVRTNAGRYTYPILIADQGSMAANEIEARRQLQVLLSESLQALQQS